MRHFPRILVHPIQQERTHPGWQKAGVLNETPPQLLANGGKYSEKVVENYVTAMGEPGAPIAFKDVPWHAWRQPLMIWGAVIALILLAVISLSVLVHRQWADKERIRYPLAELARSLLEQDEKGRPVPLYKPLPHDDCARCHTDPHLGALGATCVGCHVTASFLTVDRLAFDHDDDTQQMAIGAFQPLDDVWMGCMMGVICHMIDLSP